MSVNAIIIIGLFVRLLNTAWNAFLGPTVGGDADALGLNGFASEVAINGVFDEFRIGYTPYTNILGAIYYITINDIFVGGIFSCLGWFISAYYLKKSFNLINSDLSSVKWALIIYSFLPSSIMFTSITLREPFQLLFINLAVYISVKIRLLKKITYYPLLFVFVMCAGVLHGALLAFSMLFIVGVTAFPDHGFSGINFSFKSFLIFSIVLVIVLFGISNFGDLAYDLSGGVEYAIEGYQQSLLDVDARTHYKTEIKLSGIFDLIFFVPMGFVQYLFEPFPWRIGSFGDLILMFENILRFFLIWKSVRLIQGFQSSKKSVVQLIFLAYLAMELIWSVGTINWGTSVRHHIPAMGMLLLSAYSLRGSTKRSFAKNN